MQGWENFRQDADKPLDCPAYGGGYGLAQLCLCRLDADEIYVDLNAAADDIDEQAGRERMCRNDVRVELLGFEDFYRAGLDAEVDSVDNEQGPGSYFDDSLDVIFGNRAGIDQPGGNFCCCELLANKRPGAIVTFKDISDAEDNRRRITQFV